MGLLSSKLRSVENGLMYWCQGCKSHHAVSISGPHAWSWNGHVDKPTFSPSVLVNAGHYATHYKAGDECWCTYYAEHPDDTDKSGFECVRCHTFITDGKVQFLSDCTHEFAGQTLDLPDLPSYLREQNEST